MIFPYYISLMTEYHNTILMTALILLMEALSALDNSLINREMLLCGDIQVAFKSILHPKYYQIIIYLFSIQYWYLVSISNTDTKPLHMSKVTQVKYMLPFRLAPSLWFHQILMLFSLLFSILCLMYRC